MIKLLSVLGLTLLLLLAACGGGDDDDTGDEGSEDASTATEASDGGDGDADEPDSADDEDEDSGGGDDDANSDFHACSLFTAEEIGAVVQAEVAEGRDYLATAPGATQCTWETPDGSVAVFIEVSLEGGQDWYDAIHIEGSEVEDLEEVDGVGDVAVWDTFLGTLDTVDDDRFVAVQPVLFFSEVDDKALAIDLAEMTLERLP